MVILEDSCITTNVIQLQFWWHGVWCQRDMQCCAEHWCQQLRDSRYTSCLQLHIV